MKLARDPLRFNQSLFRYQMTRLPILFIAFCGIGILEFVWPSFFDYPYFSKGVTLSGIAAFWPLFAYGFVMALLGALGAIPTRQEGEVFVTGVVTSILAGVWEELGYRWIFICYSMLSLAFFNAVLSTILAPCIGIGIILFSISQIEERNPFLWLIVALGVCLGIAIILVSIYSDPVYWIYREFVVPSVNIVTLGLFREVFYNGYPELFVFGMIISNAAFRDGHKYQGWYGVVNSWVVGFVFMYAMLTYGLPTVIVIHASYDLIFDFVRYAVHRK